jgi:tyrosine-protein kinase Etk/Wzc
MSNTNHPSDLSNSQDFVSLKDLMRVLTTHRRLVLGLPIAASVCALVVAFVLPTWYTATVRLMPPQQGQSNAVAMLGQLGAFASGASQTLGLRNPSDLYVAMLKSRTVADSLISRFDLLRVYDEDTLVDTRKQLAKRSTILTSREGVITVEVEDRDATQAAAMANAYIEQLKQITTNLALSEASQRRLFFQNQLKNAQTDLANAETTLKSYAEKVGLVNPQGQVSLTVSAGAALRAQIAAKEIQLAGMRSFATEQHPQFKIVLEELVGLRAEMAKIEKDPNIHKGDILLPMNRAQNVGLEYVRRYREVKYFETLYEVLAKQYEIARIDEAKDAVLIQVLDNALPPDKHSSPKRGLIIIVSFLLASLMGMALAVTIEVFSRRVRFKT